jgi:CRP-like cAMP-binding protein
MIRHTEAGQKVTLFRARSGDTLAEPALFSEVYHCDAVAEVTSRVSRFDRAAVLELIRADNAFALALVSRLSGQVQGYRRRLELMAIRAAPERVFAGLADGLLRGSVIDFAAELGLTHEAVYRALSELVRAGRVERPARGVYRVKTRDQAPS